MNITALADVSFVLMVIFIIAGVSTAFSRNQGIDLDLPRTSTTQVQNAQGLDVSVKSATEVYVGKKLTSLAGFPKALGEQLARGDFDRVYLRADRKVDYGTIMEVLGYVREQGISNIGLVSLPR